MMKRKIYVDNEHEQKENTRKRLKVLQPSATDKENLAGRSVFDKDTKCASTTAERPAKIRKVEDKSSQAGVSVLTAEDLTCEEPGSDYWKILAEKQSELYEKSMIENYELKETIGELNDQLNESRSIIESLTELCSETLNAEESDPSEIVESVENDLDNQSDVENPAELTEDDIKDIEREINEVEIRNVNSDDDLSSDDDVNISLNRESA